MTTMPPMHYSLFFAECIERALVKFETLGSGNLHPRGRRDSAAARTHAVTARRLEVA